MKRSVTFIGDDHVLASVIIDESFTMCSTQADPIESSNFVLMNQVSNKKHCIYCRSFAIDDSRGNCSCCGAPR